MTENLAEKFIIFLADKDLSNKEKFFRYQRQFSREQKTPFITSDLLLEAYHKLVSSGNISKNPQLENILTLKSTRSDSGIVVVSVLTKPYPCPGKCIYCPSQADAPKSYLDEEPAVARAKMCDYHPYKQMLARIRALEAVGHIASKISVRIIGGTWSYYPKQYQIWFVKELFRAANSDKSEFRIQNTELRNLIFEQTINENAKHRIVELSVETRQDFIDNDEIRRLRRLGVTKVELGVQSIYDEVLQKNLRGNTNIDTIKATRLLKDAGFKVSYQMMVNLLGATPSTDKAMFAELFSNSVYQPDHLKIYPMALVKESALYGYYKKNLFKPYDKEELIEVLKEAKQNVPPYCRIERVIRDIPAFYIVEGGAKVSNLRQEVLERLEREGKRCCCIRCREIKKQYDGMKKYSLKRLDYDSAGGKEIILSYESDDDVLLGFLRLRIPSNILDGNNNPISAIDGGGIIREIHVYGPQTEVGKFEKNNPQHQGYGRKLVEEAERICFEEYELPRIAVIAGVGVRGYFRKLGYDLIETYMIKNRAAISRGI
jgi:elongator complex protein 3